MRRRASYTRLEEHPQLQDVVALLAEVPHLRDDQLRALAAAWRNTTTAAEGRRRALSPDTLLVVDMLRAFDDVAALYADDLDGEADYLTVDASVVSVALKAVRDAIAGTIARPQLSRAQHAGLLAPWREVLGAGGQSTSHDLGPAPAEVQGVLDTVSRLSGRCHDADDARTFDGLLVRAMTRDSEARDDAVATAYATAVVTGRRRLWTLLRRHAGEPGLEAAQRCRTCGTAAPSPYDAERVQALAADAACALLVSDLLEPAALDTLLAPLSGLIPLQRPAAEA